MKARQIEFAEMRPRLIMLLELYRSAGSEEARATTLGLFEDAFLAAAWNVAVDLLDNGWTPVETTEAPVSPRAAPSHLRLVAG